jgi:hypothetical protein
MQRIYNFSIILVIAALMAASGGLNAATRTTAQTGNWNVATTWVGGNIPTSADSVVVKHLVNVSDGDICKHLYVTPAGTVQNLSYGTRTLVIAGNLWVDGTMTKSNYSFYVKLGGNLHLNGVWSDPYLNFTGTTTQTVSATPGKIFKAPGGAVIFQDDDPTSSVKFASNLTFDNIEFIGNLTTVDFAPGIVVAFYTKPMRNANIIGHSAALMMRNGAYLEGSNFSNLTLKGLFTVGDNNVSTGEVIIADTLQNLSYGNRTLTVEGNFTNNGLIMITNYSFNFSFKGKVTNNGKWDCSNIYFDGTTDQHVASLAGKYFNCDGFEDRNANSKIILDNDLEIRKAVVNLGAATMKANGHKIALRQNAYLTNATIDNAKLGGIFICYYNCIFSSTTTVVDTLQNHGTYAYMPVSVTGNLINNGIIRKSNGYGINLSNSANFTINGPVDIASLTFAGASDQTLSGNANGSVINVANVNDTNAASAIIFNSDITFIGSTWDLGGATISLNTGNFNMQGGTLEGGQLTSNGKYIRQRGNARFINMHVTGTRLKGICQIYADANKFTNVTVEDTLQNYFYYYTPSLSVDGLFTNNGLITRSDSYGLRIYLHNDFENNGPVDIQYLTFVGATDQTLYSTAKSGTITVPYVNDTVAASDIIFGSDFTFINSAWDLAGTTIDLQGGNLTMKNGNLQNGFLHSNGKFLRQNANSLITNMHVSATRLKGICQIYGDGNRFTDVIVEDTLQNYFYYYTPSLSIDGLFTNNGLITRSNSYGLRIYLNNDFKNNGPVDIQYLTFVGATDQTLYSTAKSGTITVPYVNDTVAASDIIFGSDFTFINSAWSLAGATIDLQGGNFTMQNGDLQNGSLHSTDKYIYQSGNARFTNMQVTGTRLKGYCQVNGDGSHFTDVTVEDTLRNYNTYYSPTVTTSGDFINNGYITSWGSYSIYFNVQDVVINNGYWLSQKIIFGGNDMHYIGSQNSKQFNIADITASVDAGNITVLDDLYLLNANLNLGGKTIFIPGNGKIDLDGGTVTNTLVTGDEPATLHCSNAPTFDGSTFTNVIITGAVNTKYNIFTDCVLEGQMQNFKYYDYPIISFNGDFTNTGTLSNAPAWGYHLYNNVFGDVHNSGTWEIAESNWKGLLNQDIYLLNNSQINTPSKFLAMKGTGSFQWYKNNVAITGATLNHLDFTAITAAERGYYHCATNEGNSRTVRICTPVGINLTAEAFFCQNESVMIEGTATSGQGPFTYSWTPAAGLSNPNIRNPMANPAVPTVYTLTVTDAIGCYGEASVLVQQYPQLYANAGADDEICAGSSATLAGSASGGVLAYSYAWSPVSGLSNPNIANPIASPANTTTYTLTVTDGHGCQETDQIKITVNPLPIAYQLTLGGHFCAGVQAPIVKVANSQVGVNYSLLRNNQLTGNVLPGTGGALTFTTIPQAGTYTVRGIKAATGCEKMMTGSVSVIIDTAPAITAQSGDDQKMVGGSHTFTVTANGTAPLTYKWYFEGNLVQSGAQSTYTKSNLTLNDSGKYWVVVTNTCGFAQSANITLTVLGKQTVTVPKGWSGISTYLDIWNKQVSNIFGSISNKLILVNDFEHMYWPGQNINTYPNGAWDTYTGAQIKLSAAATMDFIGVPLDDASVDLNTGWTYLPVLHSSPVAANELFTQAQPQIIIAKDIAGSGVYWPAYAINTLGTLNPGRAYLVKVSGSTAVDFDLVAKSGVISIHQNQPENATPWNDPAYSNSSHTIALPQEVATSVLKPGDWLGVFNAEGICCGIVEFDGNSTAIAAFGDDATTIETDGLLENDQMYFKVYRSATGEVFELQVSFDASANESGYFAANGMSVISDLKAGATGIGDAGQNQIRVYPNPTNGMLYIDGLSVDSKIEITYGAGQLIYKTNAHGSQTINLGGQARGLYNIRITNQQFTTTRKVMVE